MLLDSPAAGGYSAFDEGKSEAESMHEKYWLLKKCSLLEQLSTAELSRLESRCRIRNFPRRSPIYLPSEDASAVLLLASGRVKICSFTSDGRQGILAFIEPGELFGEHALIGAAHREDFAEALEPSTVVLIPGNEIFRLMELHAEVSLGVTKLIGLRRRRIERRLKYLLYRSNRERLVHLLLELAEQYGRRAPSGVALDIRLSHQDLASVIGSTRETVTVALGELQAEGLLKLARRRIVISNLARLAQSVEMEPPEIVAPEVTAAARH
jgi:CRP-like cAMP-binding protein